MSLKKFAISTFILFVAGLIVRVMGFVYRIYLSNVIGAEGIGLYQLVTPVYSLIVLTLTSGVSISCSRRIAAAINNRKEEANVKNIVMAGMLLSMLLGVLVSAVMIVFCDQISNVILGDPRTNLSVKLLIPCIPVIAMGAALKGFYYGIQRVTPTALSSIIEQLTRILIVFICVPLLNGDNLETQCGIAVAAAAVGEVANLVVMLIMYPFYRIKTEEKPSVRKRKIIFQMFGDSMPISINRFLTSCMSAVEMIIIPGRLVAGGAGYTFAIEEFGRMSGMAMPLLFFPSIVTGAIASSLVAEISAQLASNDRRKVASRISMCVGTTMVIGMVFMAVFVLFSEEITLLIYNDKEISKMLTSLAYSAVFIYLHQVLSGIMNGLGKQKETLLHAVIGYTIRILCIWYIVPKLGCTGYAVGMFLSIVSLCVLDLRVIVKCTGLILDFGNWLLKPVFAVVISALGYWYLGEQVKILGGTYAGVVDLAIKVGFVGGIYIIMLIATRSNELKLIWELLSKSVRYKAQR